MKTKSRTPNRITLGDLKPMAKGAVRLVKGSGQSNQRGSTANKFVTICVPRSTKEKFVAQANNRETRSQTLNRIIEERNALKQFVKKITTIIKRVQETGDFSSLELEYWKVLTKIPRDLIQELETNE